MTKPSPDDIARAALERHGQTFAEELGIDIGKDTPSPLFQLLCAASIMSARIGHGIAVEAARAVTKRWRTPEKLLESSWDDRVAVLDDAGYTRYQERTATMLGDLSQHLVDRWQGDLRKLREQAGRDPKAERELIKEFKGIGDVGVDIYFREVQVAWDELFPYADARALDAARRLGLPKDPEALAELVGPARLPQLVSALVRTELDKDHPEVKEAARA